MAIEFKDYVGKFSTALSSIDHSEVDAVTHILEKVYQSRNTIFVIGNGQSAASASAFALDLTKQTAPPEPLPRFRSISLTDNLSAITAWGNDVDYESIFTEQLKSLYREGDGLLAISASGNSPNVIHACSWARRNKGHVIGLSGFEGGKLMPLCEACVVVRSPDYGFIETAHIAVMHYWVTYFHSRLPSLK